MANTWTSQHALETATAFLAQTGMREAECRLVSFRQNAVFHLVNNQAALRIYNPCEDPGRASLMVHCAEWLASEGFPAVQLSPILTPQPLEVAGHQLSCWQWIDGRGDGSAQPFAFGRLLRRLHELPGTPACDVPSFDPLGKIERRLNRLRQTALLGLDHLKVLGAAFAEARDLRSSLDQLGLGNGILHGDAIASNVMVTDDGLTLMDMDSVCFGPREWDLVPMGIVCLRFGNGGQIAWHEFLSGYGFAADELPDLTGSSIIEQLSMTVYLCLNAGRSPAIDTEIERRLQMWSDGDFESRWHSGFGH